MPAQINYVGAGSEPTFVYHSAGWMANARDAPEQQAHPSYPFCYGIDGNEVGALKRFRGFRRLDYDIREYSNASHATRVQHGLGDFTHGASATSAWRDVYQFVPHDWDGALTTSAASMTAVGSGATIYDFKGIRLDRPGMAPAVGFLIHFLGSDGEPQVKAMLRPLSETHNYDALYQVGLYRSNTLARRLALLGDYDKVDRVGMVAIGRQFYTSHTLKSSLVAAVSGTSPVYDGGETHGFMTPARVRAVSQYALNVGASGSTREGAVIAGDEFLSARTAGIRNWTFFGDSSFTTTPTDKSWHIDSGAGAPSDVCKVEPESKFQVRIRFVNKTTGFVGPMSEAATVAVDVAGKGQHILWSVSGANNVKTPNWHGYAALRALVGGDVGNTTLMSANNMLHDVVVQVFRTTAVEAASASDGGGRYFLDTEQSLDFVKASGADWDIQPAGTNPATIATGIPSLSDAALQEQEVWDPVYDIVGVLDPSLALGELNGALLSLDEGGSQSDETDISAGDIRCSPPWKFSPAAWLESTAYRMFHRVEPRPLRVPGFLKTGTLCYFVAQNRLVKCVRDGLRATFEDVVSEDGPVAREAADYANSSVFFVADSDIIEMNVATTAMAPVLLAHRIIDRKWREYVRDGLLMVGYDPNLRAIFVAPRRNPYADTTSTPTHKWLRSEALVLWLNTGRISMLHDVYWAAMTRGTHPLTGRSHLFFIDPACNITYTDDRRSDDDDQVATMTGINRFPYPNKQRALAAGSIVFNTNSFPTGIHIYVAGIAFEEDSTAPAATAWPKGPDRDVSMSNFNVPLNNASASVVGSNAAFEETYDGQHTMTITAAIYGAVGEKIILSAYDPATAEQVSAVDISTTALSGGETAQDHSTEKHGGVTRGRVTSKSSTTLNSKAATRFNDSACVLAGKGVFDRYGYYAPWALAYGSRTAAGAQLYQPALRGSQVYFFRSITDTEGRTRTVVVADARIDDNGTDYFTVLDSEINYRIDPSTGVAFTAVTAHATTGDTYSIAPVVFQVVGAPIPAGDEPGKQLYNRVTLNTLGFITSEPQGFAASGATQYPSDGTQGDMFCGAVLAEDLAGLGFGPIIPTVETSVAMGATPEPVWAGQVPLGGYAVLPVISNYGTAHNFELAAIIGRAEYSGEVEHNAPVAE